MERSFPALVNRGVKEQDLWVLNGAKTPSVLVEIGFISNPAEERMMRERGWQTKMAQAIAQGVFDYLNDY
jgi:N-acetylmuramoyl-L-alanine amidase